MSDFEVVSEDGKTFQLLLKGKVIHEAKTAQEFVLNLLDISSFITSKSAEVLQQYC